MSWKWDTLVFIVGRLETFCAFPDSSRFSLDADQIDYFWLWFRSLSQAIGNVRNRLRHHFARNALVVPIPVPTIHPEFSRRFLLRTVP